MGRWLGIDYGTRRIGVAAGSTRDGIASPLEVIDAEPHDEAMRRIVELIDEYQAVGVVVGWALNMDDTEGPQGKLTRAAAAEIGAVADTDVRLWDERLSSFAADQALAGRFTRKKKKARQDAVAAAMILQDFLAAGGVESAPRPDEIEE